jgi:anti-sigma regulatory factor (Ser/Thr protein kinase)
VRDLRLTTAGSRWFGASAGSPAAARQWARDVLPADGSVDVDAVVLLVSELTTNAVVHAKTPFTVTVRTGDAVVRVDVEDGSAGAPERTAYGMGLRVTDDVASSWGWHPTGGGKSVWFEVVGEP